MFKSVPICILTAGKTVDGREVSQQIIDDIAETYAPSVYNARINEEHWSYGPKLGSVVSAEKRGNQIFAVIKPNSFLLSAVENGQLLHTSVEYIEDFAGTGKAYLTGLALTDNPASLGTTEIKLSSQSKDKVYLNSGLTVDLASLSTSLDISDYVDTDIRLLARIKKLLSINLTPPKPSKQEENEPMSDPTNKELNVLLTTQSEQITSLLSTVSTLTKKVEKFMPEGDKTDGSSEGNESPEGGNETTELSAKVDGLSEKFDALITTLSAQTDEDDRLPAGGETSEYF